MKHRLGRNDLELLCVVAFWAFNVTVVKMSLREMEPLAFNIIRFVGASVVLLGLTWWLEDSPWIDRRDLGRLVVLGVVGHTFYQLCFVLGLARTTASSTALIFGASPVVVGLLSRLAGHERVGPAGAVGALLAFYGVYLIVGGAAGPPQVHMPFHMPGPLDAAASPAGETEVLGDLLVLGAVLCWSIYTVLSKELLERHSPLKVTALSMSLGTALMALPAIPDLRRQDWNAVSGRTWAGLVYSCVFALVISYVLWYRSVKQVGNLRTAIYSNLVPVLGTFFGVWLLGDRLTPGLALGGCFILAGILLTRFWGG
ncbi:MAG TPA: DMT family transporter [Patescibacteria group bacterium]|nr:DMT family transporter [Patescibacteria group bacterium]